MSFSKFTFLSGILENQQRRAIPILTAPGAGLIGVQVGDVFKSGKLQFECIQALSNRFPSDVMVTFMDLSVEAEAFGCEMAFSDHEIPTVSRPVVSNLNEIETLTIPAVGDKRTSETIFCAQACARNISKPVFGGMIGPYSLAGRLADMTEMMILAASEPETAHLLLSKVTHFLSGYLQALKATGIAGVVIAEPAAGLLSPDMCQEFSADYLKKIIEPVKDESFMVVLHNCGRTEKQVEAMLSAKPDALHVGNAVDILDMLPQVPFDTPLMGNLDPVSILKEANAATVYAATTSLLNRTSNFPNFVLSTGCDVPSGVPIKNIDAFFTACNDYNNRFQQH